MKMHKPSLLKKRNFCQSLAELELKEGIPDPTLFFYETPFPTSSKKRSLSQEDLLHVTKSSQELMLSAQAEFNSLREAHKILKQAYQKLTEDSGTGEFCSNEFPN